MRALIAGLGFFAAVSIAPADEAVPFPELDSHGYCIDLVSKMLDASEREVERQKCLSEEAARREALRPYWQFLDPKSQRYILARHYEKLRRSYATLASYIGFAVGKACIAKQLVCLPPSKPSEQPTLKG